MKIIKIALILLIAASVWGFVTDNNFFHIARILPFCHGRSINLLYEIGGLVMLALFLWGLGRLMRNKDDD